EFPNIKKIKMEDSKYLPELLAEKDSLDSSFTHAMKLISAETEKETYLDLFATKNQKLKERVLIPVKQFPRINFVGKLLGPGGSTIKRLQEETGAKISVLGKGSMKDKSKEEELRKSGETKYVHLGMELHVFIEVHAPIPESYLRMAHAMDEVKKFLTPVCEEELYMDPHYLNGSQDGSGRGRGMGRGRGGPPGPRGRGMPRGGPRGTMRGARGGAGGRGGSSRGVGASRGGAAASRGAAGSRGGAAGRSRPLASGAPRMLPPSALSHQGPPAQPKAEGYEDYGGYDDSYTEGSYEGYDYYSQQAAPTDTEYYDYGHGDTQETPYESYTQDDWEGSWSSAGAGGKAPPSRQSKGAYREHPYGRY
uniref:KH domain containing, RNA binding, signal transduction associated 1a n=1 Tax=Neogobius melanostomus TaxID=47308 RepID=A0A8C6WWJ0_9GOBI